MARKKHPDESPLADERWPFSREEDLDLILKVQKMMFDEDSTNPLPAFEALTQIAAYYWQNPDHEPYEVAVPFWVIQTVAAGYLICKDDAREGGPKTLGAAFNLEGNGQGTHRRIAAHLRQFRDIRIAITIALKEEQGDKIKSAILDAADEWGLSPSTVRDIWSQHAARARERLGAFRARQS